MMISHPTVDGSKPTIDIGSVRVERPDGRIEILPVIRGMGASFEPYPHDEED